MNELLRGLPTGAGIGIVLAALMVLWASGEIGERRALRLLYEPCVTSVTASAGDARSGPDTEAALNRLLIDAIRRSCGPLCRQFEIDRTLGAFGELNGRQSRAQQAHDLRSAQGRCRCAIDKTVREDTWLAHAVYVASLRLIEPAAIAGLPESVAGVLNSSRCTAGGR